MVWDRLTNLGVANVILGHDDPGLPQPWVDADVYIPAEQAHRQAQAFPRAQVHVLPGVGHWCWLEQTDQVAAHLVPFLRQRTGCPINI